MELKKDTGLPTSAPGKRKWLPRGFDKGYNGDKKAQRGGLDEGQLKHLFTGGED